MIKTQAPEPIDGLQLRAMVSQLVLFLENIEQVALEDSKWNSMRAEAINMKRAAEEMILLSRSENGLEGPPMEMRTEEINNG